MYEYFSFYHDYNKTVISRCILRVLKVSDLKSVDLVTVKLVFALVRHSGCFHTRISSYVLTL